MVIEKYMKEYSLKEKYLLRITLNRAQSLPQISGNSLQFTIGGGLIQCLFTDVSPLLFQNKRPVYHYKINQIILHHKMRQYLLITILDVNLNI